MFLSNIEEMADFSYQKLCIFLSHLATLDTQDTWPRQTQHKHSIICAQTSHTQDARRRKCIFWNNKIIYVNNINNGFFLQKIVYFNILNIIIWIHVKNILNPSVIVYWYNAIWFNF